MSTFAVQDSAEIEGVNPTQITTLDQVVSNIPWQAGFQPGAGIDAITGSMSGSAVQPFNAPLRTIKSSQQDIHFIQQESDLTREIETAVSGKYNIEGTDATVDASASYLSKVTFSELCITLIAKYQSFYSGYDVADTYTLTDTAQQLIGNPAGFRNAYGDYFIAGGLRMSQFVAIYTLKSSTALDMNNFKATFGANAPNVFSADGSVSFLQTVKKNNMNISISVMMYGYQGTPPKIDYNNPNDVLTALQWFQANEQGIEQRAQLRHYSTIVPTYPRTIPVDPNAFVDLQTLYTKVWEIETRFAAIPTIYQRQLQAPYDTVTKGVKANQGNLPLNATQRAAYQNQANALLVVLQAITDRMDFYNKVKEWIQNEPGNGESMEEGSSTNLWTFGFTSYAKSQAVQINKWQGSYSADWKVGWQEGDISFNPKNNTLIVGWQVVSNWGDGSNGCWWKTVNQIVLTDTASIHVKSLYDRGCNWSLVVYYVNADLYQFGA